MNEFDARQRAIPRRFRTTPLKSLSRQRQTLELFASNGRGHIDSSSRTSRKSSLEVLVQSSLFPPLVASQRFFAGSVESIRSRKPVVRARIIAGVPGSWDLFERDVFELFVGRKLPLVAGPGCASRKCRFLGYGVCGFSSEENFFFWKRRKTAAANGACGCVRVRSVFGASRRSTVNLSRSLPSPGCVESGCGGVRYNLCAPTSHYYQVCRRRTESALLVGVPPRVLLRPTVCGV